MVSDDKKEVYKGLVNSSEPKNPNYSKTSSKFMSVPSTDRVNLYSAICSECHVEVKVNFEPVKNQPFLCDYCYKNHRIHPPGNKLA